METEIILPINYVFLSDLILRNFGFWYCLGIRNEAVDDSRANLASTTSISFPSGDVRPLDQDGATVLVGGVVLSSSKVISGASEVLVLLRTLGEGYRFSCLYRCQVIMWFVLVKQKLNSYLWGQCAMLLIILVCRMRWIPIWDFHVGIIIQAGCFPR